MIWIFGILLRLMLAVAAIAFLVQLLKRLKGILKFLVSFVVGFVAIAYLAICLLILGAQQRFIFLPTAEIQKTPDAHGLNYEEVWIPTGEGANLYGWWIPANPNPSGTLLYMHGNGINIGANVDQSYRFQRLGFSVLVFDYRGYGRSEGGFPSEAKVYRDAESAWRYLTDERGIPPENITLYGHSLGGAIAIELATHHPDAAAAIVQSSFTSMRDMVGLKAISRFFPVPLLLHQRFDSIQKVKSLEMPVWFIHGKADPLIPYTMSEALYAAAPEPKQLSLVEGAGHNNGSKFDTPAHEAEVLDFVALVRGQ